MAILQELKKSNGKKAKIKLSPTQKKAYNDVLDKLKKSSIVGLNVPSNFGKTTVLKSLSKTLDGKFIRLADIFYQIEKTDVFRVEEAVYQALQSAFEDTDVLVVDDFSTIEGALSENYYARRPIALEEFVLDALKTFVEEKGKNLIVGLNRNYISYRLYSETLIVQMEKLKKEDYAFFFKEFGGIAFSKVDYKRIHQFSANLSVNQIKKACKLIEIEEKTLLDAEQLLKALEKHAIVSNVNRCDSSIGN